MMFIRPWRHRGRTPPASESHASPPSSPPLSTAAGGRAGAEPGDRRASRQPRSWSGGVRHRHANVPGHDRGCSGCSSVAGSAPARPPTVPTGGRGTRGRDRGRRSVALRRGRSPRWRHGDRRHRRRGRLGTGPAGGAHAARGAPPAGYRTGHRRLAAHRGLPGAAPTPGVALRGCASRRGGRPHDRSQGRGDGRRRRALSMAPP